MKKRYVLLLVLVLLLTAACMAVAEEARDVTAQCTLKAQHSNKQIGLMTDRDYTTCFTVGKNSWVEIGGSEDLGGLYLQWYEKPAPCEIQWYDGADWQTCAIGGTHLSDWFPLPEGTRKARVMNRGKGRMRLAELTVYGAGDKPASAQSWRDLDRCDLMLMTAHPDDEVLWFGGLLPYYAGERGLDVQVACMVPTTPNRRLELLDSVWTCGVTAYPAFGTMRDVRSDTLKGQYKLWQKDHLWSDVTAIIRRYKPDVLVTHDFDGEYGHGAHRAVADAASKAVKLAASGKKYPKSAKAYGVWQVSKLYVHLYGTDEARLDWHQPLTAFDGEDGLSVATRALACHRSQVKHGWAMTEGGDYDNSRFGLYYTTVGEDTEHDDLMANIAPRNDVDTADGGAALPDA